MASAPATAQSTAHVALGMNHGTFAELNAAGAPPELSSYWVGVWMATSGWAGLDSMLKSSKANGVTPVLYWYYWGDSISPSCVENGCNGRSKAQWDSMTNTLAEKVRTYMGGSRVIIVLENEFNKGGITDPWYAPTFDTYLEAKTNQLGAIPGVEMALGYGSWGEDAWGRFPKAIAASDMIGFQLMRASSRDTEATYRASDDKIASVLARIRTLSPGKDAFLYDVALSSYPDDKYRTIQDETLQSILDRRAEYASNGLRGLVYREVRDNPSMGTHNYFGYAEQFWGFKTKDGVAKPAWSTWVAAASGAAPPPPPPPPLPPAGSAVPGAFEGEAMTASTGGRTSDASASGGAVWNLWTNGQLTQRVTSDGGAYRVSIVARGSVAAGIDPVMELRVDGARVASWSVPAGALGAYDADVTLPAGDATIAIAFTNDALVNGQDRNLFVDVVRVAAPNRAPAASFVESADGLSVLFDASPSSDADGDALAYAWSFGDGATGEGRTASHAYAQGGTYSVTLTVSDGVATARAERSVSVRAPNANPVAAFDVAGADLAWSADASASSDPEGEPLAYAWSFGDGATASGPQASHAYAEAGTYTITLAVTDPHGASATATRQVTATAPNRAPAASFAATGAALAFAFDAAGSSDPDGDALSYAWSFGDGTGASGPTASKTYAPGTYTVTLTVTDARGLSASAERTVTAVQPNRAPSAGFTVAGSGLSFTLDASGASDPDGDALSYAWDLGDGRTATGRVVSVTYATGGERNVRLVVDDGHGATGEASQAVRAQAPAAARAAQGEGFAHKDNGMRFADGAAQESAAWLLWANGAMTQTFQPGAGSYRVEVLAKGDVAGNVWPAMELRADGVRVASWSVGASAWRTYAATLSFKGGEAKELSLHFTNDAMVSGQDRNLRVDALRLVPAQTHEAEAFATKANGMEFGDAAASGGAGWLLWSNGAMTQRVSVEQGSWTIEVVAKGDLANGAPKMEVRLDGTLLGRFDVSSTAWQTYRVTTTMGGEKTLSVSFVNDYRGSGGDRNLRVDAVKLVPS